MKAGEARGIDFRARPDLYRVGRGEEGVLSVEPYKSEILPFWRFRTRAEAEASARAIWALFVRYRREGDFVGMDMARKFLQMGFTRARRYANHPGGRKYAPGERNKPRAERRELPRREDPEKAESARIFKAAWDRARNDPAYRRMLEARRTPSRGRARAPEAGLARPSRPSARTRNSGGQRS